MLCMCKDWRKGVDIAEEKLKEAMLRCRPDSCTLPLQPRSSSCPQSRWTTATSERMATFSRFADHKSSHHRTRSSSTQSQGATFGAELQEPARKERWDEITFEEEVNGKYWRLG